MNWVAVPAMPEVHADQYASASIRGNNRVVFNIGGSRKRQVQRVVTRAARIFTEQQVSPCTARKPAPMLVPDRLTVIVTVKVCEEAASALRINSVEGSLTIEWE